MRSMDLTPQICSQFIHYTLLHQCSAHGHFKTLASSSDWQWLCNKWRQIAQFAPVPRDVRSSATRLTFGCTTRSVPCVGCCRVVRRILLQCLIIFLMTNLSPKWVRGREWRDLLKFQLQIRDNSAKLGVDDLGNFTYSVDTSGFRPDELNVSIEGDELVVHGEHKQEAANGETVHRQFVRRVLIPEGFQKEGLKCELDDSGRMCVTAPKAGVEPAPERRSIPIDVKPKADAIGESKK